MSFHSIYVHIPFCQKRCNYCDFVSFAKAKWQPYAAAYPELLKKELQLSAGNQSGIIQTVYFGGGTPVVLPSAALIEILQMIRNKFALSPDAEITIEANPGLLNQTELGLLRQAGFNRLSLGGQSFFDADLQAMGRIHKAADISRSVEAALAAGFENIGVDLIYGLPGQTIDAWRQNLEQAAALPIKHISLYGLQLDNQSPWGKLFAQGKLQVPDQDLQADMFLAAIRLLPQLGFRQYEIANFCRRDANTNWQSHHNSAYWQRQNYLGLGLGAASCLDDLRYVNCGDLEHYARNLNQGKLPPRESEKLSPEQVMSERIFLGLRLLAGIDLAGFKQNFDFDIEKEFAPAIKRLTEAKLLAYQPAKNLRLTERGILLGNQVFAEFLL